MMIGKSNIGVHMGPNHIANPEVHLRYKNAQILLGYYSPVQLSQIATYLACIILLSLH